LGRAGVCKRRPSLHTHSRAYVAGALESPLPPAALAGEPGRGAARAPPDQVADGDVAGRYGSRQLEQLGGQELGRQHSQGVKVGAVHRRQEARVEAVAARPVPKPVVVARGWGRVAVATELTGVGGAQACGLCGPSRQALKRRLPGLACSAVGWGARLVAGPLALARLSARLIEPTAWTLPRSTVACSNDGMATAAASEITNGAAESMRSATAGSQAPFAAGHGNW
jgi:hypothetical protein